MSKQCRHDKIFVRNCREGIVSIEDLSSQQMANNVPGDTPTAADEMPRSGRLKLISAD